MSNGGTATTDYLSGEELYQKRARAALPLLVRQVAARATIFYSDLATELAMPNPRNLNHVLGYIGTALESLSRDWDEEIPPIQCVIINKEDRLAGEAVGYFITDLVAFRKRPRKDQWRLLDLELTKIWEFPKWPSVLSILGLPQPATNYAEAILQAGRLGATQESRASSFGTGGESPNHKNLKNYIARHPEIVGLPARVGPGRIECPLKSGDTLDVFFTSGKDRVAIEVKSKISQLEDIVRGMFQCIKYKAVLEAEQAAEQLPQSARAILVLESKLPENLVALKNILGIELIEEVKPYD